MPLYRINYGTYLRRNEDGTFTRYKKGGDPIELNELKAKSLKGKVSLVLGAATGLEGSSSDSSSDVTDYSFISEQNVDEVKALISEIDDPNEIEALYNYEESQQKPRKTILDAARQKHTALTNAE